MHHRDGWYYYGDWVDDRLEGKGELKDTEGGIYIGEFKDNKTNGYGELTFSECTIHKGYFKDGAMHGDGISISYGELFMGTWVDGELVEGN